MTITMFIMLVTIFSIASGFLTEGIKTWYKNNGKNYSANMIALINSLVLGCFGTPIIYVLMEIPFTASNIVCIPLMGGCIWLGCMIGYDKVMQLIAQVTTIGSK